MSDLTAPSTQRSEPALRQTGDQDFKWLDANRQALVFQTIQEGLTADPPRTEATFDRVVKAYLTLTKVVKDSREGSLSDESLAALQEDIQAAGGYLAPGLTATGDQSLAKFRKATFGLLERTLKPRVASAAVESLNCYLKRQQLTDIGELFQAVANFLRPLGQGSADESWNEFTALDAHSQELVFATITDALSDTPIRQGASFQNVVYAFSIEHLLISEASAGTLGPDLVIALETAIADAGGKLSPNLTASGQSSVEEFRTATFDLIEANYPTEVADSILLYLNGRLKNSHYHNAITLFGAVRSILAPVIVNGWEPPSLKAFNAFNIRQQSWIFETMHHAVDVNSSLEPNIFELVVSCYTAERSVVQAAKQGLLSVELLHQFRQSLADCGGYIEPGISISGANSIQQCIEQSLSPIRQSLAEPVFDAMFSALNSRLAGSPVDSVNDVICIVNDFTLGLRSSLRGIPPQSSPELQPESTLVTLNPRTTHPSELSSTVPFEEPATSDSFASVSDEDLREEIAPSNLNEEAVNHASTTPSGDLTDETSLNDVWELEEPIHQEPVQNTMPEGNNEQAHEASPVEGESRLIAIQDVKLSLKPAVAVIQAEPNFTGAESAEVDAADNQETVPSIGTQINVESEQAVVSETVIKKPSQGQVVDDPITNYAGSNTISSRWQA